MPSAKRGQPRIAGQNQSYCAVRNLAALAALTFYYGRATRPAQCLALSCCGALAAWAASSPEVGGSRRATLESSHGSVTTSRAKQTLASIASGCTG